MGRQAAAHTGQIVSEIKHAYPSATVHAFEPVTSTFDVLTAKTAHFTGVSCHRLAVSSESGRTVLIENRPDAENNSIVAEAVGACEAVETIAGADFCERAGLVTVDYLKIDAEGHDMQVLEGFRPMLERGAIQFVEVEAGMHEGNTKHIHFLRYVEFFAAIAGARYQIFGLYEQVREGTLPLRRANIVFVADPLAPAATG